MPLFGSRRRNNNVLSTSTTSRTRSGRRSIFHRVDPDRRAGGYKAALHNPATTHEGRQHAKYELKKMGRGHEARGHPSLKSRIKHFFGIRSNKTKRTRTKRSRKLRV